MKRVAKITIICPIEIDDDVDVTNESELGDALSEAVGEDLFSTEYLSKWESSGLCGMQCDQCKVRKTEGEQTDRDHIEQERLVKAERFFLRLHFFEHLGIRVFCLGVQDQADRDQCRNAQHGETDPIGGKQVPGSLDQCDKKEDHRSQKCSQLIQKFLISKPFAGSDLACRKADKRVFRGLLYGFADPFQDHQTAGSDPAVLRDERQCRNSQHLNGVSGDDQGPVLFGFIRDEPRKQPQGIAA